MSSAGAGPADEVVPLMKPDASKTRVWAVIRESKFGPDVPLSVIEGDVVELVRAEDAHIRSLLFKTKNGRVGKLVGKPSALFRMPSTAGEKSFETTMDFGFDEPGHMEVDSDRLRQLRDKIKWHMCCIYLVIPQEKRRTFEEKVKSVVFNKISFKKFADDVFATPPEHSPAHAAKAKAEVERMLADFWQEWNDCKRKMANTTASTQTPMLAGPPNQAGEEPSAEFHVILASVFKEFVELAAEDWIKSDQERKIFDYCPTKEAFLALKATNDPSLNQKNHSLLRLLTTILSRKLSHLPCDSRSKAAVSEHASKLIGAQNSDPTWVFGLRQDALPRDAYYVFCVYVYSAILHVSGVPVKGMKLHLEGDAVSGVHRTLEGVPKAAAAKKPPKYDINSCAESALTPVVGVGIAKRIIEKRSEVGGFKSMADFKTQVSGVGGSKLEQFTLRGFTVVPPATKIPRRHASPTNAESAIAPVRPAEEEKTAEHPRCPITHQPFVNPVVASCCGHSFERDAIMQWIHIDNGKNRGGATCPLCDCPLNKRMLVLNRTMMQNPT